MSEHSRTIQEWAEAYQRVAPLYEAFAEKLRLLLCDLLKQAGMPVVQTEARGKEVDSFAGKLERKPRAYEDPLTDVMDLAGVRIITYYLEDARTVGELVAAEFEVDEAHSVQKGDDLDPDRFGYRSDHYVVRLKSPRSELAEWASFADLRAEIQVRTATQHAWAAVEHRLGYKTAAQMPRDLRRRLYRLSALFEMADEQFSGVRDAATELQEEYSASLRGGDLAVPLDVTSLDAYIQGSPRVEAFSKLVHRAGANVREDGDEPWPGRRERDRSDLIHTLNGQGVATLQGLDELLRQAASARAKFKAYVDAFKAADETAQAPKAFIEDFINVLAFILSDDPQDDIAAIYVDKTTDAILTARRA